MIIGPGTPFFSDNAIFVLPQHFNLFEAEFLSPYIKILPVCLSLFGAFLGFILYYSFAFALTALKTSFFGRYIYTFLSNK